MRPEGRNVKIFLYFARTYTWHTSVMVLCLVLAGFAEGLGLSSALPLIGSVEGGSGGEQPPLARTMRDLLGSLGLRPELGTLLALIALGFTLKAVLLLFANKRVGYTVARAATDLRLELLRALLRSRWSYYTRLPVGSVSNAVATEADRASQSYLFLAQMCAELVATVVYASFALAVSWRATLVAALGGGISLLLLNALVRLALRAGTRQTKVLKLMLARLNDAMQSVKLLKATAREDAVGPLLEGDTERLNRALRKRVFSKEALIALQEPILVLFVTGYLYFAVARWNMPIGSVLVLIYLFVQVIRGLNKSQRKYQVMLSEGSALWSIREMIDQAHAHAEPKGGTAQPTLERGIELEHVTVDYGGPRVLEDLTLEIPAGGVTAIIGGSGTGKSTLTDLLTGLIQPQSGLVKIDGVPLPELDLSRWRRMIGYVPQEILVMHDSVRVNVTLGDPSLSDADVERALQEAGALEFVARLPEGLATSMGERGTLFSGGQRQRIAIARALVHRPKLLILDEATAALDPVTEAAVWEAVARLRGKTTVVAISHQPALAGVADRIYRIEDLRAAPVAPPFPRPAAAVGGA
jgi:ATP-binding cassette subfamily C protein